MIILRLIEHPRIELIHVGHLEHLKGVAVDDQLYFRPTAFAFGRDLAQKASERQITRKILQEIAFRFTSRAQM